MTAPDDETEDGCGWTWDHTTTEETRDGETTWVCSECGAEGWTEAESR